MEKAMLVPETDVTKTVWLTPENASFYRKNGLLWLVYEGKETRVSLRRNFPMEELWGLLSVLNEKEEEVGMVRSLDSFEGEEKELLMAEL